VLDFIDVPGAKSRENWIWCRTRDCKVPADIARVTLIQAGFKPTALDGSWFPFRAQGCSVCNKGYKGRIGVHQVMPVSKQIQRIILRDGSAMEIAAQAELEGVRSLRQSGLLKVKLGLTSLEEILSCTND
jgi:type IV pilus assembly protein PilB